MYVRPKIYPSGSPIPESLPDSYQPAAYGNAPAGQSCFTCKSFDMVTRRCARWDAPVKPRWWCEAWTGSVVPLKSVSPSQMSANSLLTKKITTSTVEEHFSKIPAGTMFQNNFDNGFNNWYPEVENEEDVIKVNVPLLIRLLEYARESAASDIDLHLVAERMIELSESGEVLEMEHYSSIVPEQENGTVV